jgi:hypothetical protein
VTKRPLRLGELLVQMGRVTEDQVAEALAWQQEHGGYMGDALLELGFITREELRWSLADQYDLPFVRLRPENIDPGLAAMVPAAWAREHHILPVLRVGDTVTVVIGSVTDLEKLDEVRRMTGAGAVEPALSSPEAIDELIESVFAPELVQPVLLTELLDDAMTHGAVALGVSVRRGAAVGWYRVVEMVRRPLLPDWEAALAEAISPMPPLTAGEQSGLRAWRALLSLGSDRWWVDCSAAGRGRSLEWAARLSGQLPHGQVAATLEADCAEQLRQARSRGPVLVRVSGDANPELQASLGRMMASLPGLVLGQDTRSVHLTDAPVAAGQEILVLPLQLPLSTQLDAVAQFAPQAVTVEVDRVTEADAEALRRAAALVVVHTRAAPPAFPADLSLHLRAVAGGLSWFLSAAGHGED